MLICEDRPLILIEYISIDSPSNALKVLTTIKKKSSALYRLPERGGIAPELQGFNILQYRENIIEPWRVIYKVTGKSLFLVSVIDSRRNVEDVLLTLDRLVNHKT